MSAENYNRVSAEKLQHPAFITKRLADYYHSQRADKSRRKIYKRISDSPSDINVAVKAAWNKINKKQNY